MKPLIKIKITDWWRNESFDENYFIKHLRKKYDVIEDENPQYLLYSVFGYEHTKYDCIRIFFTGENICPDFNVCDYAIGFHHIDFEDRYIRYPLYLIYEKDLHRACNKHSFTKQTLENKNKFCNFIYSHSDSSKLREKFFEALSLYKKVDSAGSYRNNIGRNLPIINGDFSTSKYEFIKDYKFSIAFENSSTNGYSTEKIIQAFGAKTIPIYWGDKKISMGGGLNEKAFINILDSSDFDKAINTIIKIDNDNALFEKILKEPVFCPIDYPEKKYKALMDFFDNIFSQDLSKANRRKNEHWFKNYDFAYKQMTSMLRTREKLSQSKLLKIFKKTGITKAFKKILKL